MFKTRLLSIALLSGLGLCATALAQTAPPDGSASRATTMHPAKPAAATPAPVIKPGDRNCVRDTGSMIPAKKGQCLQGVFGRSYSARELRNTGQPNTADALRMLDPAIH